MFTVDCNGIDQNRAEFIAMQRCTRLIETTNAKRSPYGVIEHDPILLVVEKDRIRLFMLNVEGREVIERTEWKILSQPSSVKEIDSLNILGDLLKTVPVNVDNRVRFIPRIEVHNSTNEQSNLWIDVTFVPHTSQSVEHWVANMLLLLERTNNKPIIDANERHQRRSTVQTTARDYTNSYVAPCQPERKPNSSDKGDH